MSEGEKREPWGPGLDDKILGIYPISPEEAWIMTGGKTTDDAKTLDSRRNMRELMFDDPQESKQEITNNLLVFRKNNGEIRGLLYTGWGEDDENYREKDTNIGRPVKLTEDQLKALQDQNKKPE